MKLNQMAKIIISSGAALAAAISGAAMAAPYGATNLCATKNSYSAKNPCAAKAH